MGIDSRNTKTSTWRSWVKGKINSISANPITFYDIGVWNMDSTVFVDVTLTGVDYSTVDNISAIILNDGGTEKYNFLSQGSSTFGTSSHYIRATQSGSNTVIRLSRAPNGFFDSTSFNDSVQNRGRIMIVQSL